MNPAHFLAILALTLAGLVLAPSPQAVAQSNGDAIFSAGFEDPCGFPPGPTLDSISLGAGSLGTEITLNGNGLDPTPFRVFLAGPQPSEALRVELQVTDRQPGSLTATLGDPLQVGAYNVVLETCTDEVVLESGYETPTFTPVFGEPGQQVVMNGAAFGSDTGSLFVAEAGGELEAGMVDWRDNSVRFALDAGHASNGPRGVRISAPGGSLQLTDGLVIHRADNSDDEGPGLVSAVATSNTTVLAQFTEAIIGGPDGAGDPSLYRITAPARFPTVNVLSAEVLAPDYDTVRLTTMSQSDLIYTLEVTGIEDLAGNPLAEPDILVDPTQTDFAGMPPNPGQFTDSDGDGLSDSAEQRGWTVNVRRLNGTIGSSTVTSDPGDPRFPLDDPINMLARDTDGDGVGDFDEKNFGTNPRSGDTDADGLGDNAELNEIYSDPTDQDSDGDSYADGLEFDFFRTSPILADTDGDQLTDDVEIALGSRNPLVADLPSPTIEVGESNLQLDVRFLESTETSTNEIESRSVSSTLSQSDSTSVSNTNSNTQEAFGKLALGTAWEVSGKLFDPGAKFATSVGIEAGWSGSWTASHTADSQQSTERAYQDSLETQASVSEGASVSREVVGASMQVTLALKSTTSLAYSLRNLQVTALKQDPLDPTVLTPIATLLPDNEPPNGFALGPLTPERGPIILSSDTVFPQQVEALMRNPRGLVFEISNFDIVDELGRNFAFTSQDIIDRTAAVVIDNGSFDADGDGEGDLTEYNRVSTGFGRLVDTNEDGVIDENDRRIVFDGSGNQLGVTLVDALDAIGLTRYREDCPPPPPGEDPPEECRTTDSLSDDERENSYSVEFQQAPGGDAIERIVRVRNTPERPPLPGTPPDQRPLRTWEVLSPTGIEAPQSLSSFILQTEADLKLAFVQDLDNDRLSDGMEFLNDCSDDFLDTDADTMDDRFEVLIGWTVDTGRGLRRVFSRCTSADSDGDGLSDAEEAGDLFYYQPLDPATPDACLASDPNLDPSLCRQPLLIQRTAKDPNNPTDFVTDPSNPDTDGDGVSDSDEIDGYDVTLRPDPPGATPVTISVNTDPNDPDTDGDGASDGLERDFGGDPTVPDLDSFTDEDGDGLVNLLETDGWVILVEQRSSTLLPCDISCFPGTIVSRRVTSDPMLADTDFDGLTDDVERDAGTDPRSPDTDGDGLTDAQELLGVEIRDLGIVVLDPLDADTDDDLRTDGEEAELVDITANRWVVYVEGETPYRVYSNPLQSDEDFDRLVDGLERSRGTDPTKANTDGDVRNDAEEVALGTDPLAEDFLVTVRYQGLTITESCDGTSAGEWFLDLGAITPSGNYQRSLRTSCESFFGQAFPPPSIPLGQACANVLPLPSLGLPDCPRILGPMGQDLGRDQSVNLCYVEETYPDTIQILPNTNLSLARDIYETSFGVTAFQEFALAGEIKEGDSFGFDPESIFRLDDRFNETLMIDGSARSGFFNGSELSPGFINGTFEKPSPCSAELRVLIRVQ